MHVVVVLPAQTGAAASFVLFGAVTIDAPLTPLAAWLALSTFGGADLIRHAEPVLLSAAVATLIPLLGVMTVFTASRSATWNRRHLGQDALLFAA